MCVSLLLVASEMHTKLSEEDSDLWWPPSGLRRGGESSLAVTVCVCVCVCVIRRGRKKEKGDKRRKRARERVHNEQCAHVKRTYCFFLLSSSSSSHCNCSSLRFAALSISSALRFSSYKKSNHLYCFTCEREHKLTL